MIKFYENMNMGSSVAVALNQAQMWLRDISKEELENWTSHLPLTATQEDVLYDFFQDITSINSTEKPFKSPYYWAAFYAICL
jgi:CHAT domain-containing protein